MLHRQGAPADGPDDVRSVIVADDDRQLRTLLRRMLEEAGFAVREAREGSEAVQLHRSRPADIVVCDVYMPGMDGMETIQQLRGEFPALKILAMSGGQVMDLLPVARLLGASDVIRKPMTPEALVESVERLLEAGPGS